MIHLSLRCTLLLLLVSCATVIAQKNPASRSLYYVSLDADITKKHLLVHPKIKPYFGHDLLQKDPYGFSPSMHDSLLDGPMRRVWAVLHHVDGHRDSIFEGKTLKEPVLFYRMVTGTTLRNTKGKALKRRAHRLRIGIAAESGNLYVATPEAERLIAFDKGEAGYREMLSFLFTPKAELRFPIPKDKKFLVDMHFLHPTTPLGEKYDLLVAIGGHKAVWRRDDHDRYPVHLGTAAFEKGEKGISVVDNHHLKFYRESQYVLKEALTAQDKGDHAEAEQLLKKYLAYCPSDPQALAALGRSYLAQDRLLDATALVNEKRVFLNHHPHARTFMAKTERLMAGECEKLLDERDSFDRVDDKNFRFVEPIANDTVAGEIDIELAEFKSESPILRLDMHLNGKKLKSLYGPPYTVKHQFAKRGRQRLEAKAWFYDRTFRQASARFKTVDLGAEEAVNLVTVRAVVTQNGRKFLRNLERTDFQIIEKGVARPIVRFTQNQAPLNVAILVDTSGSMGGEKIYSTQFAVSGFLDQLESRDSAAIYTFDQKVLRHSEFTNQYDTLSHNLNTLSAQSVTSLYDAIMTAHKDLMKQKGTKAIIVVSDGRDTNSSVRYSHLKYMLADSEVMLYPIHFTDGKEPEWAKQHFATLVDLADATGCVASEVENLVHLDQRFQNIYQELKSYYLLNFYTRAENLHPGAMDLFVKKFNARARFRPFHGKLNELFDGQQTAKKTN